MPADIRRRCQAVEQCYEFTLAYAAQGLASETGNQSSTQIREVMQRAVGALSGFDRQPECLDPSQGLLADLFLVSDIVKQHIQSGVQLPAPLPGRRCLILLMISGHGRAHDCENDDADRLASDFRFDCRWTGGLPSRSQPYGISQRRYAAGVAGRSRAWRGVR